MMPNAIHHYDENGLFTNQSNRDLPPQGVARAQNREVEFVKWWMRQWNAAKADRAAGHGRVAADAGDALRTQ